MLLFDRRHRFAASLRRLCGGRYGRVDEPRARASSAACSVASTVARDALADCGARRLRAKCAAFSFCETSRPEWREARCDDDQCGIIAPQDTIRSRIDHSRQVVSTLALEIRSAYRPPWFRLHERWGTGAPAHLSEARRMPASVLLVSLCRDTLPKPSQLRLPLQSRFDPCWVCGALREMSNREETNAQTTYLQAASAPRPCSRPATPPRMMN